MLCISVCVCVCFSHVFVCMHVKETPVAQQDGGAGGRSGLWRSRGPPWRGEPGGVALLGCTNEGF